MPNVVSAGGTVFWIIWVNALFIFTLVLPHQASYIFPFKSGIQIASLFKKIKNKEKNETDNDEAEEKEIDGSRDGQLGESAKFLKEEARVAVAEAQYAKDAHEKEQRDNLKIN
tara:strand:- start:3210 stop:3548 length:339 start_codon:yes stop_codon:yes gene_type:complete